jgi:endonuclease/exonuclease/phosphatase family metal-dependent hydrolase
MKLLQWNIWYKEKIENIASLIQEIKPDILCLQELSNNTEFNAGIHTAQYLRDVLGMNMFYREGQKWSAGDKQSQEVGNAIYSTYPIASGSYTYINDPTNNPTDFSAEGRVYLEVDLKIDKQLLTVGTTHMSYTREFIETEQKKRSTDLLLNKVRKNRDSFIFSGDFNVMPDSYTTTEIEKSFVNVGPDNAQKTWTTKPFIEGSFQADSLNFRLDYVFATPDIHVASTQILQTPFSDHLPIVVEFELPPHA